MLSDDVINVYPRRICDSGEPHRLMQATMRRSAPAKRSAVKADNEIGAGDGTAGRSFTANVDHALMPNYNLPGRQCWRSAMLVREGAPHDVHLCGHAGCAGAPPLLDDE